MFNIGKIFDLRLSCGYRRGKNFLGENMEKYKNTGFIASAAGLLAMALMLGILFAATVGADEVRLQDKLLGLMYHQVLKDSSYHNDYCVSPDELEEDLKFLSREGFTSLLPSEAAQLLQNGEELPEKAVMISFDDGYETAVEYVLPLLEKYKMKAVFNIVGDFSDEYTELPDNEKNLSFAYLSWQEVKTLEESEYAEIGNHTYSMHVNGGDRQGCARKYGEDDESYRKALYGDIQRLQLKLSQLIGKRPVGFAYPFGLIGEDSDKIIESAGINVIMTCEEKPTVFSGLPLTVNRYNRAHGRSAESIYQKYLSQI